MAGYNIELNDDLRRFVDQRVDQKGFSTPADYLQQLIREDHQRFAEERLEQQLLSGLDSGDAGELDAGAWDRIEQNARGRMESGADKAEQ